MLKLLIFCSVIHITLSVECYNGCINVPDCPIQSEPCSDAYCFYVKKTNLNYPEGSTITHGCRIDASLKYEQTMQPYTLVNQCSSIVIDNVMYTMKICNNSDYCSTNCINPLPYNPQMQTTPSTFIQPTTSTATTLALFLPFFVLLLII